MADRVAILVDGDNISAAHADRIGAASRQLGKVDVKRVYANFSKNNGWSGPFGYRHFHAGSGKNGADLLLAIDAIELALNAQFPTFVIASSDRDLSHLALRLRELGAAVHGMGEEKAPQAFRQACTSFEVLGGLTGTVSALDLKVKQMIATHGKNGEGMLLTRLGAQMYAQHKILKSDLPDPDWRSYITRRPTLYQVEARGKDAKVRFRPEGFE